MEYAEAAKKVRAEKPKENFMAIKLIGDDRVILPHKDGQLLIQALTNAEKFDSRWSPQRILAVERGDIEITTLSHQEYERFKIAALLNISPDEVKALENPQLQN